MTHIKDEDLTVPENPRGHIEDTPETRSPADTLQIKFNRLFDAVGEMRFITSRDGKILDLNQAGVELFGFRCKEEMLRMESVGTLFRKAGAGKRFQLKLETDGFVKDYEVEMVKNGGEIFTASISATMSFEEDGSILCDGILRDVTALKTLQEAYLESEKQNRELSESERRVRKLSEDILNMLMIMSHDIRGPLVAIAATLKLLMRGSFGRMDDSVWNTVQELMARVRHLIGIAEDCLGRANSMEGMLCKERHSIDLRQDIIDPVLDEVSNEIEAQGITIDNRLGAIPAGCIPVSVNMMWLKAVFRNLFRNAIKYGGRGCRIAFGFEDHGAFYRLNVYNSGTPIPQEYRERLFTKFSRIDQCAGERDGFGMGLYLIREIVRKHGGDIWYEAKRDGSDFILILEKAPD